jgi:hypothetical protein
MEMSLVRDTVHAARLLMHIYGAQAARHAERRADNLEKLSPDGCLHWRSVAEEIRRLEPSAEIPVASS